MENKTAVEWLIEELGIDIFNSKPAQQALELEKQQIVKARITAPILPFPDFESYIEEAENYYSEKYPLIK